MAVTEAYEAMQVASLEGPTALLLAAVPRRSLEPGEVRITVRAAGVNFPDLLMTRGLYQNRPELPFSPGMEVSGVVAERGASATRYEIGSEVFALGLNGGFASEFIASERTVLPKPKAFTHEQAATFGVAAITAYHALVDKAQVSEDDLVLVAGASGGVGLAAVQLAKAKGASVVALASSSEKRIAAAEAGADAVVDYRTDDLRRSVEAVTEGRRPSVVYDPVGGALSPLLLSTLAWDGAYLIVGFASGEIPSFPANHLLMKSAAAYGVRAGESYTRDPKRAAHAFSDLLRMAERDLVTPRLDRTLPLTDAAAALTALEDRSVIGRIALTVSEGGRDEIARGSEA